MIGWSMAGFLHWVSWNYSTKWVGLWVRRMKDIPGLHTSTKPRLGKQTTLKKQKWLSNPFFPLSDMYYLDLSTNIR